MIKYHSTRRVGRPAAEAFNVVGTHAFENHPQWEDEVLEVRRLTPRPMGVGSRGVMVRQEYGKRTEVEYEVTRFEPGHRIDFRHNTPDVDFNLSTTVTAVDGASSEIDVALTMGLHGWQRIMEPLIRLGMPRKGKRIMGAMARVAETAPVLQGG